MMKKLNLFLTLLIMGTMTLHAQCDFEVSLITNNPTCHGFSDGSITLVVTGVGLYSYEITDADGTVLNAGGSNTANSLVGDAWYYYTVVDEIECEVSDSVYLDDPEEITIDYSTEDPSGPDICDGTITVDTVYGVEGDVGFYWTPTTEDENPNDSVQNNACHGIYMLIINTDDGCSATFEIPLAIHLSTEEIAMANLINVYAVNQELILTNVDGENINLEIYSVTGEKVFSSTLINGENRFNLTLNGGVYVYLLRDGNQTIKSGKFNWER